MTVKTIGRKTLLKYTVFSVVTIFLLLTVNLLIFGKDNVSITLGRILSTFGKEFAENLDFVAIQTIITLLIIWYVGGLCGQLIIEKEKNKYIIGGLAVLTLWIGLFIGTTFTAMVIHSIKYAGHGTESVILNWIIYGLIPSLILGLIHALIVGFPLGREIQKGSEKLNAVLKTKKS